VNALEQDSLIARGTRLEHLDRSRFGSGPWGEYRDARYVIAEVERLAEQVERA